MKKILSILLSILIIIPSSVVLAADGYTPIVDEITKAEAYQFADELKEMSKESSDSSLRLIVNSNKKIDYLDAISTATGIDNLYVLQFDNKTSLEKAEEYYNSLDYVNYVEHDFEVENPFCSIDKEFDYGAECPSTINQNIDDAIKLLKKENAEFNEIKMAVLDSGIVRTKITNDRIDGGHTFVEGANEDGTSPIGTSQIDHGTKTAGTIILNTLDNVRLYSYQVRDADGRSNYLHAISSVYLAVADECKIINMSLAYYGNFDRTEKSWNDAINTATKAGCICIAAAGNDGKDIKTVNPYPAMADNCISVGATTPKNYKASFSNFGDGVDIYAVGSLMTSYDIDGKRIENWGGTSGATPVISSICALLITAKPNITVDEIKQLFLETGYSFNEANQSDKDRIIADAYGCVKKLLGKELEQVDLNYTITKNESTNCSDITFSSNNENVKIYYTIGLENLPETPYKEMTGASQYEYKLGETINLSDWRKIIVAAYAPGKEKKVLEFSTPTYSNESGYRLTQSSKTQQYNRIDRCQFIDEKVIEVPETINGTEVQEIGDWCFIGNKTVEKIILPKTVKQIDRYAFANCPNLKEVIAPGVEICGMYAFSDCENLKNVELPNVTVANTGMFKNCTSLETAKLGELTEIDNHAFFGCENLKLVKTTNDDISFAINTFKDCDNLTIATPEGSTMETYAVKNDIPLLGEVTANGGSIRVTDAGLRFGYQYNGEVNENIEEYGFVYNSGATDDLTVDNALKLVANNRIDHGNHTTYNLVFTSVPYTDKAFNLMISAKAYIKIGGEYFYSNTVQHSYNTVANAVLNDETIDSNTKDAVQNILDKVV